MTSPPSRRLLLIAYHFPPIQGSTGTSRTIAFSRYLTKLGWDVCVLTIEPRGYEEVNRENEALIPPDVRVARAWGFDTRRTLSVWNRYPILLALPDRWQSWIMGGYRHGKRIVRDWGPDVLMSTYPVPSAHVIGFLLHRKSGIPWVAEFRDPMLQKTYPGDPWERWAYEKTENAVFRHASEIIVTTEGCRRMYVERFPDFPHHSVTTISNGYDPAMFSDRRPAQRATRSAKIVLLHSGLLYPHERNPTAFFHAVRSLADAGFFKRHPAEFRFRASGNEVGYEKQIEELGIDATIKFLPRIPYMKALDEMQNVDGLVLFQADNCNDQIPAKVYEYLYCGKPILGLVDPRGDTGKLLHSLGIKSIAKLENSDQIAKTIRKFLTDLYKGSAYTVPMNIAQKFSRESLTTKLAVVLNRACQISE